MKRHYQIETLTEELMRARVQDILALEELFYRQFGLNYANEVWTEKHFLYPLLGKWELSKVAFDEEDRLIGFWISSYLNKEELRGHRAGTHPEWRGTKILRALFEDVYANAKRLGFSYISGTTNAANPASLPAWLALGFRIVSGSELETFRVRRGREHDHIEENFLVSPEGYRYYALCRDIE